jgi:hypothetical protein
LLDEISILPRGVGVEPERALVRDEVYRCNACRFLERRLNITDDYEEFRRRWNDHVAIASRGEDVCRPARPARARGRGRWPRACGRPARRSPRCHRLLNKPAAKNSG